MPTLLHVRSLDDNVALAQELQLGFIELNMGLPQYASGKLRSLELKRVAARTGLRFTVHLPEEVDFGHDAASGFAERDYLLGLGARVRHTHLHDFHGKDHQELYTGCVDVHECIGHARSLGVDVVIETKDVLSLRNSVKKLRERNEV